MLHINVINLQHFVDGKPTEKYPDPIQCTDGDKCGILGEASDHPQYNTKVKKGV